MHFSESLVSALAIAGLFLFLTGASAEAMSSSQAAGLRKRIAASKKKTPAKKRDTRKPVRETGTKERIDVATLSARNLVGRIYDQTRGADGGRNYDAGQIVCVDVPRLALDDAGVSMADILLADARMHPGRYPRERSKDNLPGHPIFARRTRNWLRWARGNDRLLPPSATPKVGDVAFYGPYHIAYVSQVEPNGSYRVVENAPSTGVCMEQYDWMMALRGWKPSGFGRILPLPNKFTSLARRPKDIEPREIPEKYRLDLKHSDHPGMNLIAELYDKKLGREPLARSRLRWKLTSRDETPTGVINPSGTARIAWSRSKSDGTASEVTVEAKVNPEPLETDAVAAREPQVVTPGTSNEPASVAPASAFPETLVAGAPAPAAAEQDPAVVPILDNRDAPPMVERSRVNPVLAARSVEAASRAEAPIARSEATRQSPSTPAVDNNDDDDGGFLGFLDFSLPGRGGEENSSASATTRLPVDSRKKVDAPATTPAESQETPTPIVAARPTNEPVQSDPDDDGFLGFLDFSLPSGGGERSSSAAATIRGYTPPRVPDTAAAEAYRAKLMRRVGQVMNPMLDRVGSTPRSGGE